MKTIRCDRFAFGANGTFGRLRVFAGHVSKVDFECLTIEPPSFPWVPENERDVSAIPVGEYRVTPGTFHRGTPDPSDDYPCLVFLDGEVPGRGRAKGDGPEVPGLKVHGGNTVKSTKGCPLVGDRIDFLGKYPAVLNSRTTLANLLSHFEAGEEIRYLVRELRRIE